MVAQNLMKESLRKSERKYRTLTNNLNVAVYRGHIYGYLNAEIIEVNPAYLQMFGYDSLKELTSVDRDLLYASNKDRLLFNESLQKHRSVSEMEINFRRKDGTTFVGSVTGVVVQDEETGIAIWDGIIEDITERKKAQENVNFLHDLLRHDIRNIMQRIQLNLHLIQLSETADEEKKEMISKTINLVKNSQQLLDKITMLEDIEGTIQPIPTKIHQQVLGAIEKTKNNTQSLGIKVIYNENHTKVLGGPLLEELFFNLLENAINHANCTKIVIAARQKNKRLAISVEDDGKGISSNITGSIFERGTKGGNSNGLGIGLYLCNRIIKNYQGIISVGKSNLGGAKFEVVLSLIE